MSMTEWIARQMWNAGCAFGAILTWATHTPVPALAGAALWFTFLTVKAHREAR